MSYVKTQWVNNTTPINDTNLNKIEQGIYDNSLVVDAVTNTINPTDTETYKTAELTEGQITDVIGVSDIVIKGQTSQNGEPTPSSPIDVNVVSGSNVVNTSKSNKNLFIPTLKVDNTSIFVNNATVSLIKDEYTFIASNTDMYFGQVANTGATYSSTNGMKIYKNGNTKLSFLVTNTTFNRVHITAYNSQGVSLGYTAFNGISGTYTFPENCEFVTIRIGKNTAVSGTTYKTKVMVVYGDTIPTTYEPHQGKELPLDLPVENLYNPNYRYEEKVRCTNGTATEENGVFTLTATGNDLYMWNVSTEGNSYTDAFGELYEFKEDVYSVSITNNKMATNLVSFYDENKISLGYIPKLSNSFTVSKLEKSGAKYFSLRIGNNKALVNETYKFSVQLEKGSKANAYTPYGTDPIELCKIGNYQDYFYKSGSKWYLHKETGKVVLNGSESWTSSETTQSNKYRAQLNFSNVTSNNYLRPSSNAEVGILLSNYYSPVVAGNNGTYGAHQGIAIDTLNYLLIYDENYNTNDISLFKTWLASNNVSVYYLLATATNTEITDTILISQLEAIYNAPLYEQTNITQTNNDLPMVLDITACKDNINGIKAFIRK